MRSGESEILPSTLSDDKMQILAGTFNCRIGTMPFPYLGLPVGITKPFVTDYTPIVRRIERGLLGCSQFITQAEKLEMLNTVLSSIPVSYTHLTLPTNVNV